jgi:hypothetical protein
MDLNLPLEVLSCRTSVHELLFYNHPRLLKLFVTRPAELSEMIWVNSCVEMGLHPVFKLTKNKWGLTISRHAYSLSLSLHTGDSASLTTAGVETDPPGYPRASCLGGGVKQTTGGFNPQPPRQFKHWLHLTYKICTLCCLGINV